MLLVSLFCLAICSASAALPESPGDLLLPMDDDCDDPDAGSGECALSALQLRGVKLKVAPADASSHDQVPTLVEEQVNFTGQHSLIMRHELLRVLEPVNDEGDIDLSLLDKDQDKKWWPFSTTKKHPINLFNSQLDSSKFLGVGLYYEFNTAEGKKAWSGQVEGRPGSWAAGDTPFPLASASKLYTAFAAMYTMQLKPRDFYPEKYIHEFKGWEDFKNFRVHNSSQTADLTIHHLLTHTSGLPFGMRVSKEDIAKQMLFYVPGTAFGYTLGHRIVGWILRDYWKEQPEGKAAGIETVGDTFRWLYWDQLGLSEDTRFSSTMHQLFGFEGDAGDASIQSTGDDLMKLAVVALNKGKLPSGKQLISEANWDRWAIPNLLPSGKLSKDLVAWEGASASWYNWNVGGVKEQIMKQSGDYGWNYFGATYFDSTEIGWCGFFSSCLRVTYPEDLAFVMMQEDVADLKKSKPYLVEHFDSLARSLQCNYKGCGTTLSCQQCEKKSHWFSRPKLVCKDVPVPEYWVCPSSTERHKFHGDTQLDNSSHICYVPRCHHG